MFTILILASYSVDIHQLELKAKFNLGWREYR